MSIYTYKLSNYRAIKNADIKIDGITVLAGENGSGKSTLSRFLYYIVKVLSDYEVLIDKAAKQELYQILFRIERASSLVRHDSQNISYRDLREYLQKGQMNDVAAKMQDVIEKFGLKIKEEMAESKDSNFLKSRLSTLFRLEKEKVSDADTLVDSILGKLTTQVSEIEEEAENKKKERSIETFLDLSYKVSDSLDNGAVDLDFEEDGVGLLQKDHFNPTLNLNRVIYYKTYELMDYLDNSSDFHDYLEKPVEGKLTDEERLVAKVLRDTLGGEVVLAEDDIMPIKQLHFKRKDGLKISLKQAATGLVSFSFLQRLLENGYFKEGTLLIIDEPEAHLHPKWIVEYARMLVMIQKYLKVKIVLSTHNPDMLAAIDSIARREHINEVTNFYFAKPDEEDAFVYNYQKLDSIEEIFDSFNTALIKIQEYGKD